MELLDLCTTASGSGEGCSGSEEAAEGVGRVRHGTEGNGGRVASGRVYA